MLSHDFHSSTPFTADGRQSKAMADQIMTLSKQWLTEHPGLPSPNEMRDINLGNRRKHILFNSFRNFLDATPYFEYFAYCVYFETVLPLVM
jgi:hypothetical protein